MLQNVAGDEAMRRRADSTQGRGARPGGREPVARYRARPVKTSGRVVLIVVALVALTIVAAVALASAFGPGGGGGSAAPAAAPGTSGASTVAKPASSAAAANGPAAAASATPTVSVVSGGDTIGDRGVKAYIAVHGADRRLCRHRAAPALGRRRLGEPRVAADRHQRPVARQGRPLPRRPAARRRPRPTPASTS